MRKKLGVLLILLFITFPANSGNLELGIMPTLHGYSYSLKIVTEEFAWKARINVSQGKTSLALDEMAQIRVNEDLLVGSYLPNQNISLLLDFDLTPSKTLSGLLYKKEDFTFFSSSPVFDSTVPQALGFIHLRDKLSYSFGISTSKNNPTDKPLTLDWKSKASDTINMHFLFSFKGTFFESTMGAIYNRKNGLARLLTWKLSFDIDVWNIQFIRKIEEKKPSLLKTTPSDNPAQEYEIKLLSELFQQSWVFLRFKDTIHYSQSSRVSFVSEKRMNLEVGEIGLILTNQLSFQTKLDGTKELEVENKITFANAAFSVSFGMKNLETPVLEFKAGQGEFSINRSSISFSFGLLGGTLAGRFTQDRRSELSWKIDF